MELLVNVRKRMHSVESPERNEKKRVRAAGKQEKGQARTNEEKEEVI